MTSVELLQTLQGKGVSLAIQGDRLRVDAPVGVLTPEMREVIAAHKTSLMTLMSQRHTEPTQLPLVADVPDTELECLRAQRDVILAQWNATMDRLEALGQNTTQHAVLFGEWERLNTEYKAVCEQIWVVEGRAQYEEWIRKQPAPKGRKECNAQIRQQMRQNQTAKTHYR
jgi:hypothetical protein